MRKISRASRDHVLFFIFALSHVFLLLCAPPSGAQAKEDDRRLISAAVSGDIPALKELLKRTSGPAHDAALTEAARQGQTEAVKTILSILRIESPANFALIDAVEMAGHYEDRLATVEALLNWGADPNAESIGNNITLLMMAVDHGNIRLVSLLLGSCADVSARDDDGRTARDRAEVDIEIAKRGGDRSRGEAYEKIRALLDGYACVSKAPRSPVPAGLSEETRKEIERLYSPDPGERLSAIGRLGKMGPAAAPAVPFLVERLCEGNRIGWEASRALAEIGPLAVGPLINALNDGTSCVRGNAASALGQMDDPRIEDALIKALKDRSAFVRRAAAGYFEKHASRRVAPFLIEALKDGHFYVKFFAVIALASLKDPLAVEPLIAMLRDEYDFMIVDQVIYAMSQMEVDDQATLAMLIQALKERSNWVREGAIAALDHTDDPLVVDPLIEALRDEVPDIRDRAARKLGQMKDPRAVGPLIQALEKAHERDRRVIAEALTALTGEKLGEDPVKWRAWRERKRGQDILTRRGEA